VPSETKISLDALRDMGEWMALGFYEGLSFPWPRAFGLAFRRLYENMAIRVPEDRLLFPCEPFPQAPGHTRADGTPQWYQPRLGAIHHATGFLCDYMHSWGIHGNPELVEARKRQFPQYAGLIDALMADLSARLPCYGDYTHSNPDIRRVVNEGFDAMEQELDAELAAIEGDSNAVPEERNLLLALKDYAIGVRTFHARTVAALDEAAAAATGVRQEELRRIADAFAHGFLRPARSFLEGLLAVHFVWMLDGCDSIGRVDQALGDLFEQGLRSGRLDLPFARRLLDELFRDFERLNGWNLQIGGYRPDGADGYNELTHELLLACERNRLRLPNVAFRITRHTPQEAVRTAIRALGNGTGRPALYNDDLYVETLLASDLGLTPEDARDLGFGGCTETMIPGMSNVGCIGFRSELFEGNDLNLAKILELALHDGYDPVRNNQVGPHTGHLADCPDFPAFLNAVRRQIQYATDVFVADLSRALHKRFTQGDPKLYRTFFTRDCVKRRRSFEAGGARYNWSVVNYAGIANLIDGLAAVRKCVFDERTVSAEELIAALKADFQGYEPLRQRLLAAPKFGNDDPYVDDLGRDILTFAWQELRRHEHPRGGRYLPACLMFVTYGQHGAYVGALPDGRKAGTPLADSTGPMPGRDTRGPTAMLASLAKLPLHLAIGTPVVNIRFPKSLLASAQGIEACVQLVRTYFAMGGLQLQVSVISREEMLAAQQAPDQYRDLIVRIGGYSEYFVNLNRTLQESVIARTEHGVS